MSRECILHVGMHKTGTSSIQASLHRNLANADFRYADLGRANHSGLVCSALSKRSRESQKAREALEALRQELARNESRTLIISGEGIGALTLSQVVALRELLLEHVARVRVVAYVRSPIGYIESAFQQRLKANSVEMMDFSDSYPQYRFRFEKFDTVFGRENVELWKFEPKTFPAGCVVRDFCSRLGIDFPSGKIVRVNEGLSRDAVALLYAYRRYYKDAVESKGIQRAETELVQRLSSLKGKKLRFLPAMVKRVVHENRQDLEWMERRLGSPMRDVTLAKDEAGVASEEDLMCFEPEALRWLEVQLDRGRTEMDGQPTAQEVAAEMRALVEKLAGHFARRPAPRTDSLQGEDEMTLKEIVAKAKQAAPDALGNLQDGKAVALVREVFRQIAGEIEAMEEGVVKVGGLGQFRIMKSEREKEGQKIAVKRIVFRVATTREPGAGGEE